MLIRIPRALRALGRDPPRLTESIFRIRLALLCGDPLLRPPAILSFLLGARSGAQLTLSHGVVAGRRDILRGAVFITATLVLASLLGRR